MNFITYLKNAGALTVSVLLFNPLAVPPVHAHARWVVPSHTVVSGDKPVAISLDYSISNDIFHPDIALGGKTLAATESKKEQPANPSMTFLTNTQVKVATPKGEIRFFEAVNLGRKTSTYFTADIPGTYRVDIHQPVIDVTLFKNPEGESQRLFGRYEDVKSKLPKGASQIESLQFINRIQTFVTFNQTSRETLLPTGQGLELEHTSHPNEIFAKEKSNYQLMLNGKQLAGSQASQIKITKAGTRFRNQRDSIEPKLSQRGHFQVTWPEAGLYLIEIDHEIEQKAGKVVYALFLTVEVHPE